MNEHDYKRDAHTTEYEKALFDRVKNWKSGGKRRWRNEPYYWICTLWAIGVFVYLCFHVLSPSITISAMTFL